MNKTDRLLAIVLELQGKKRQRAEDLAQTFETSKRTIYRDIQALCEAGVPIISIPGLGYSLMEGYFLPPLTFNTEEATMLLLGSDFMAQHFDAQYRLAAESAYRKIAGVLPEQLQAEVAYLQSSIRFIARDTPESELEKLKLQQLRRAIIAHQQVCFLYHSRNLQEGVVEPGMEREVDPYGLFYISGVWYLVAYCHLRLDMRNFRLDRLDRLELSEQTFQRPTNFQFQVKQQDDDRKLIVKVLFEKSVARWVREARSYYTVAQELCENGLLVTLAVRREQEVVQWLLSWGSHVKVLEPTSLARQLQEEAERMVGIYQRQE